MFLSPLLWSRVGWGVGRSVGVWPPLPLLPLLPLRNRLSIRRRHLRLRRTRMHTHTRTLSRSSRLTRRLCPDRSSGRVPPLSQRGGLRHLSQVVAVQAARLRRASGARGVARPQTRRTPMLLLHQPPLKLCFRASTVAARPTKPRKKLSPHLAEIMPKKARAWNKSTRMLKSLLKGSRLKKTRKQLCRH